MYTRGTTLKYATKAQQYSVQQQLIGKAQVQLLEAMKEVDTNEAGLGGEELKPNVQLEVR